MAVQAAYEVHVDLDGDRDFSGVNEDLSADWKSMWWQLGVQKSSESLARACGGYLTHPS